jgi:pimeloyl-ACP methyl ester carboxylesterase
VPVVHLADGDLNYQLEGPADAPVLLLSNSLGTDLGMWDTQMPAFTEHFRVLRYDTRGHGQSQVSAGFYSIEQLGRDVLALLDHLDIARVHFCGLSMGGLIGQWLGIHAGERLDKLVLCNTAAKIASDEVWNSRGTPRARAAYATPWPKLPADATTTGRSGAILPSPARPCTATHVPRPLNEPIGLTDSTLTTTGTPSRLDNPSWTNCGDAV